MWMATFGLGVLNQPHYLGPGTSAAYRLPSPNISGTCLAPQSHRLSRRVQLTPLCVIQHEGPSQFVSKFLWPSSENLWLNECVTFMPLLLGLSAAWSRTTAGVASLKAFMDCNRKFSSYPPRGPQDHVKCIMGLISFMDSNYIYIYYPNMMVSYDVIPHSTTWLISGSLPKPAIEDFDGYLPRKCRLLLSSTGMYTKEVINGKTRVTGGKRLKSSGAYTKQFGRKVASLFKKNRGKVTWLGLVWYVDSCM